MVVHGNEVLTETLSAGFLNRNTLWETLSSEKYFKWLLIVPLLLILAIFTIYPMFYCLYYSFHEWGMVKAPVFLGLAGPWPYVSGAGFKYSC
jgi:hypothetical protein